MKTETDPAPTTSHLRNVSSILRWTGWLGFWLQLGLGIVAAIALLFVFSGRNFSRETTPGIGISLFWSAAAIAVLLFSLYQSFRYSRLARRFRMSDVSRHPKKSDTIQLVRWSIVAGLLGMLLALLGAGAAIGVLVSKAIALPQGVAIYDPARIIRPLDIFAAAASLNLIAAHFVGTVSSLWLFSWLHRQ
jgi:hypothetical protein